jgi:hypothetical protein
LEILCCKKIFFGGEGRKRQVLLPQASVRLTILLPLPPEYWDYRCGPPHLANYIILYIFLPYRGQVINMRYLEYFEKILHFIKDRILVYHG